MNNAMPTLSRGALAYDEKSQLLDTAGDPIANMRYAIVKEIGGHIEGITDAEGNIQLVQGFAAEHLKIEILGIVKQLHNNRMER
jgi:type VI secretion system secreted protein VgrG